MIRLVSRPNGQYGQSEENNSLPCWSRFVSELLQQTNGWYPPDVENRDIQKDAQKIKKRIDKSYGIEYNTRRSVRRVHCSRGRQHQESIRNGKDELL